MSLKSKASASAQRLTFWRGLAHVPRSLAAHQAPTTMRGTSVCHVIMHVSCAKILPVNACSVAILLLQLKQMFSKISANATPKRHSLLKNRTSAWTLYLAHLMKSMWVEMFVRSVSILSATDAMLMVYAPSALIPSPWTQRQENASVCTRRKTSIKTRRSALTWRTVEVNSTTMVTTTVWSAQSIVLIALTGRVCVQLVTPHSFSITMDVTAQTANSNQTTANASLV